MKKIAFVRRNGLGDLLCSLPMIAYCRKLWPEAKFTLFLSESNALLAPYLTDIDKIVVFPKGNKYVQLIWTALLHRKDHYDMVISARPGFMRLINYFMIALGAKKRVFVERSAGHQALQVLRSVAPHMQEVPIELYPKLQLPRKDKIKGTLPSIFVSMTNNFKDRQISVEQYARILNRLGYSVVISCMSKDRAEAICLHKLLTCPANVVIVDTLDQVIHLINDADLALMGDSGLVHIAAFLDKPQVILFGPTSIERWRPLSKKAICLRAGDEVSRVDDDLVISTLRAVEL